MTKFKKYVSILLSVSLIAGVAPMDAQAKTVEDKKAAIQTINEKETMTAQAETGSLPLLKNRYTFFLFYFFYTYALSTKAPYALVCIGNGTFP